MTAKQILIALRALNIMAWVEAGKIKLRGPTGSITTQLKMELTAQKEQVIEALSSEPERLYMRNVMQWPPILRQFWENLTLEIMGQYQCSRDDGEATAHAKIIMGWVGIPDLVVHQNQDGTWPRWADELGAPNITWKFNDGSKVPA